MCAGTQLTLNHFTQPNETFPLWLRNGKTNSQGRKIPKSHALKKKRSHGCFSAALSSWPRLGQARFIFRLAGILWSRNQDGGWKFPSPWKWDFVSTGARGSRKPGGFWWCCCLVAVTVTWVGRARRRGDLDSICHIAASFKGSSRFPSCLPRTTLSFCHSGLGYGSEGPRNCRKDGLHHEMRSENILERLRHRRKALDPLSNLLSFWLKLHVHRLSKSPIFLLITKNNNACPPTHLYPLWILLIFTYFTLIMCLLQHFLITFFPFGGESMASPEGRQAFTSFSALLDPEPSFPHHHLPRMHTAHSISYDSYVTMMS